MKKTIHTDNAPKAVGPYSQAVLFENLIFTAGQIALDPLSGKLVPGDIREQTHQVMKNLKAVLAESKAIFSNVIKATVFLNDMDNFSQFNEVYATYFTENPPARSTVQVAGLPLGAMVEIELIAYIP